MIEIVNGLIDTSTLYRFGIHLISLVVLIRYGYERKLSQSEFVFSFYLFGIGVFLVTLILKNVEISLGFAFGLFAIFSMLRYRTESISIKGMTYLFLVIVMALISAVGPLEGWALLLVNSVILVATLVVEYLVGVSRLEEKVIRYERIDNIRPENRADLLEDLRQRTGLDIEDVSIDYVDFMTDSAKMRLFYRATPISKSVQHEQQESVSYHQGPNLGS